MEISEKEIKSKIQIVDKKIFENLFNEYYIGLCYLANDYVKNKETAEDIVGDVFYKLWENKEKLEINASIKSYLFKTVQNHCINYLKHKSVAEKYTKNITNETQLISDQNNNYSNYLLAQELQDKINKAISTLPPQCQQIFKLNRFEELKYKEIAKQLSISIKTVETQMSRALKKIRNFLREYLE